MRILFNMVACGLANTGGCQTILRMALALRSLGHDVKILLDRPHRFTWFDFDQKIIEYVNGPPDVWPESDVIIATACSTVRTTLDYPHVPLKKKFYWIRAIENWAMPLKQLQIGYESGLTLIVNSEWQKRFIFDLTGINPFLVYSGLPIEEIERFIKETFLIKDRSFKKENGLVIGALYSHKPRKSADWITPIINESYKKGFCRKVWLFGDDEINSEFLKGFLPEVKYSLRPSMEEKVKQMLECDVWLSTTDNEGLHIPPLEAGLCYCNIVVRDLNSSGVSDYAMHCYSSLNFLTKEEAVSYIGFYWRNQIVAFQHLKNLRQMINLKIGSVITNATKILSIITESCMSGK